MGILGTLKRKRKRNWLGKSKTFSVLQTSTKIYYPIVIYITPAMDEELCQGYKDE